MLGRAELERAFDLQPGPACLQDEDFRLVRVNEPLCRLLRCEAGDLLGKDPAALFAEDAPSVQTRREQMSRANGATVLSIERPLRRGDGSFAVCRLHGRRIRLADGTDWLLTAVEHIGELARRAADLITSEDLPRLLFERSPVPMSIQGDDYRIIAVNDAYCDFTGYPRETLVGRDPRDVMSADVSARLAEQRRGYDWEARPVLVSEDQTMIRADGSTRRYTVIGRFARAADGRGLVLGTIIDETRVQALAAELQEAVLAQSAILRTTIAGVALARDGCIRQANPALLGMLGLQEPGTDGESEAFTERLNAAVELAVGGPRVLAGMKGEAYGAMAAGRSWRREIDARGGDGAPRVLDVHATALRQGFPARGTIITVHDITQLRALERERLEHAARQRDALVREVHHRIKNNLQGVAGLLEHRAVQRPDAADELLAAAARIQSIADIYALQGRPGEPIGVEALVRAVATHLARTHDCMPALEIHGDCCRWTLVDNEAVPLALVLNELLTNAIKHREPGGAVGVQLRCDAHGLRIECRNDGAWTAASAAGTAASDAAASGLALVTAMLPPAGAMLAWRVEAGRVLACLQLAAPAIEARTAA